MSSRKWLTLGLAFGILLTGASLHAQKGKGKGHKEKKQDRSYGREVMPPEVVFSREERVVATGWFHGRRSGLPPGLAKREHLPPGLEKQLHERGTLPPGLQKKFVPVPVELERRMRPLPTGYRRVVIGAHIAVINERTSFVCDIMRDVIPW